jgi:hypothetical protein
VHARLDGDALAPDPGDPVAAATVAREGDLVRAAVPGHRDVARDPPRVRLARVGDVPEPEDPVLARNGEVDGEGLARRQVAVLVDGELRVVGGDRRLLVRRVRTREAEEEGRDQDQGGQHGHAQDIAPRSSHEASA